MPGGIQPPDRVIFSWPSPNFKDPETRGQATVVVTAVLGVISVLMVGTRLVARAFVQHNFGIDDWVIVAAMFPTIGMAVGICLATQVYGFDKHVWDLHYFQWPIARKIEFGNEFLYIWSSGLIKISILLFYKRMTKGTFSNTFIYVIWASIAFVVGYIISFTFVLIFSCNPVKAMWLEVDQIWKLEHKYKCIDEPAGLLAASSVALVQDIIAATLPMALFWGLEIPKRQKIALITVFSIGYFLVAVNAVRMYWIYRTFYTTYDTTWTAYEIWLWTAVEILVAPMCASAPALKVFFRGILQERPWQTWSSRSKSRASKAWQQSTNAEEEVGTTYNDEPKEAHDEASNATSQTAAEDWRKPPDSPTLGKGSVESEGMELDYFKSVRETSTSDGLLPPAERPTPSPSPRISSKAEQRLGL